MPELQTSDSSNFACHIDVNIPFLGFFDSRTKSGNQNAPKSFELLVNQGRHPLLETTIYRNRSHGRLAVRTSDLSQQCVPVANWHPSSQWVVSAIGATAFVTLRYSTVQVPAWLLATYSCTCSCLRSPTFYCLMGTQYAVSTVA